MTIRWTSRVEIGRHAEGTRADDGSTHEHFFRPCVTPQRRYPRQCRMANSYTNILGPQPGILWLLMTQDDLEWMTTVPGPYFVKFHTKDESGGQMRLRTLTIEHVALDYSERVFPGKRNDPNALHLVKAWDGKLWADRMTMTTFAQYNIPAWAVDPNDATHEHYLDVNSKTTWAGIMNSLWNKGLTNLFEGDQPTWVVTPQGRPERMKFLGMNLWRAYNHVWAQHNHALQYNPASNSLKAVRLDTAQNAGTGRPGNLANRHIKREMDSISHVLSYIPRTTTVYFHKHYMSYGQERDTERLANHATTQVTLVDLLSLTFGNRIDDTAPGTNIAIWDALAARYDEDNALINGTDLTNQATTLIRAWEQEQLLSHQRERTEFTGIWSDILTGSQCRAVHFRNGGSALGGSSTTLINRPGLIESVNDGASDGMGGGSGNQWNLPDFAYKMGEPYSPPDIGRASYANYPRLQNIVEVDVDTAAENGRWHAPTHGDGEPSGIGFYSGRVVRYVAGVLERSINNEAMTTDEICWVMNAALGPGEGGTVGANDADHRVPLRKGGRYMGRLSGIETIGGDTRPVYVVAEDADFCYSMQAESSTPDVFTCVPPVLAGDITLDVDTNTTQNAGATPVGFNIFVLAGDEITINYTGLVFISYKVNAQRDGASGSNADDAFRVLLLINGGELIQGRTHAQLDDIHDVCDDTIRADLYFGTCSLPCLSYFCTFGDTVSLWYERTGGDEPHTLPAEEKFLHVWAPCPSYVVPDDWPDGGLP